ncbi:MAG: Flp pilus assembly protein TadD, partial [Myxococcota bacterium]
KRRYKAAAKEYAKALAALSGPQPLVSAKLAGALLRQGHNRKVPGIVTPALELNPNQVLLYLYRGKARLALGRYEAAHRDLVAAVRINPFDPEVHGLLAEALDKLGRSAEGEEERRLHRLVNSR